MKKQLSKNKNHKKLAKLSILTCFVILPLLLNAQIVHTNNFNSSGWANNYVVTQAANIKWMGSGGYSGGCIEIRVVKGGHYGCSIKYMFKNKLGYEPTELEATYRIRWDASMTTYRGKAPGFDGTYDRGGWGTIRSDGYNGWCARGSANAQDFSYVKNEYGVYHVDQKADYADVWAWNVPKGTMNHNQWYTVTQYVKLNTPNVRNGVLKAYVNGAIVYAKYDIMFRKTSALKIYSYWINFYHGGNDVAPQTGTVRMDDLTLNIKAKSAADDAETEVSDMAGNISVFPNPVRDGILHIQGVNLQNEQLVSILNIYGQTFYSGKLANDEVREINIQQYGISKGIYFVKLENKGKITTQKFVVE